MDVWPILVEALRASIGVTAAAYAISAIGLNVQFGYAGLLNFGHVASLMMGAYGLAITVSRGGPMWLGVIVGIVAAVVLGLILGIPTLRLRADYLAITTIAASEILRFIFRSSFARPLTNSVFGIQAFANDFFALNPIPPGRYGFGTFRFDHRQLWVMALAWLLVAVSYVLIRRLIRSPWGRVLRAVREDEDATASLGKNVFFYKLQALMIGGAIGAVAGIVLAIDQQNVHPDSYQPLTTFYTYTIVIMGGTATLGGPVIGAMMFWFAFTFLEGFIGRAVGLGWFGSLLDTSDVGPIRFALVGVALMLLMVYRPQGVFGSRSELLVDTR